MKLTEVFDNIDYEIVKGTMEKEVFSIAYDSRKVTNNSLFLCVSGFKVDGHTFINSALEKGATTIVVEKDVQVNEGVTIIKVKNTREVLAQIAKNFYRNPSSKLNLIGVTGTNGKTSTTFIIKSVLNEINHKVGIVGTMGNLIGDKEIQSDRTTPESLELQELFSQMVEENVNDVVMEVSSHALHLNRVDCCDFDIGIFTNLTQDHLDYHETMENYKLAKAKLFSMAKKCVINVDDLAGEFMVNASKGEVITFGIDNECDLKAENIEITIGGVDFQIKYKNNLYPIKINTPGKFSIYNALGSVGACLLMGISMEDIISGIETNSGIKGRFQAIKSETGKTAVVDYAHTPDGLENILKTAKEFVKGRVITVFGCGGDRDRTKRPIMGEIAGKLSDYCLITSDNPRTEDPEKILLDVEEGMKKTSCAYEMIVDRKEAIYKGVSMATENDLIIIAGKGHEDYQIFADKTIHFDDGEVVREAFKEA